MKDEVKPRLPVVGEFVRSAGTLVEVQDVTPPVVPTHDWIFSRDSAKVLMRINGIAAKEFGTFNDHYGKGTCVASAIEHAKERMELYKLAPGGGVLEFVVIKTTEFTRMRPGRNAEFYDREFFEFKSLDHGRCWKVPEDIIEQVWSSKESQ